MSERKEQPAKDGEPIEPPNPSTGPQKPGRRDDPSEEGARHPEGGHQREPGYDQA